MGQPEDNIVVLCDGASDGIMAKFWYAGVRVEHADPSIPERDQNTGRIVTETETVRFGRRYSTPPGVKDKFHACLSTNYALR